MLGNNRFPNSGNLGDLFADVPQNNSSQKSEEMFAAFNMPAPGDNVIISESRLRPEQAEAFLAISSLLSSDLNPGSVLRKLMSHICSLFHANRSAVFLRKNLQTELTNPPSEVSRLFNDAEPLADIGPLICAVNYGLSDKYISKILKFYEDKEFNRLQVVRSPVYVADAQTDTRLNGLRELSQREGFLTMLTLPLLYRQTLIGIMVLYHDQHHTYSNEEIRLLTILSNQAALAITNARLYEEARRREMEAASLAEASRIFNASLKLREVLPNIVEMALKILGNTAMVFIVRENTDLIYPVSFLSTVTAPPGMPEPSPVKNSPPVKVGLTLVGKVVQTGTPIFINHNADTARIAPFLREMDGVEDIICVPLKVRGRIIGALVTYNMTFNGHIKPALPLEDRHISLAQALADRAAVAIANSQMYEAERREQRAKDEFLSLIAHELKTPLTALMGYNRLLGKQVEEKNTEPQKLKESLQHYSGVMDNQLERLQTLVEDLTSISLIETNQLELHTRPADIVPIIKNQISEMEKLLKSARLPRMIHQFELRAQPTPVLGIVDVPAFERVIYSLLNNAVKFSPKGGTIRMRVQQVVDEVLFTIQDEGLGISIEEQGLIFERFYKASSAAARANGLGLGLYISQGLMKAMGGRIEVESEEGGGSVFTVALRAVTNKAQ